MKIGFDAKRLYNNFTGLGNYSRFIVDALCQSYPENEYVLFTPTLKRNSETEPFLNADTITTVLPPSWMTTLKLGSMWRSFRIGHEARHAGINVYHGLSHELPYDIPTSIRSIVTIHDLIFLRYPQFYNSSDVAIYKTKVTHACKVADAVVAISEQTARDVVHFLAIKPEKIHVVYQGCHPNFKKAYSPKQLTEVKNKYNLPDKFILNVGTIEPRKNALLILKALKILKNKVDIFLVIVGRPTSYLSKLKEYAHQAGLAERIVYIHQADFIDLPAIYKLAKVFVYPSLFEGFGIPLIEAIECGIPVITSNDSCFHEAAGPAAAYIEPNDEAALAFQVELLVTSAERRHRSVEESQTFIKRFDAHVIAENMMNVYQSIRH